MKLQNGVLSIKTEHNEKLKKEEGNVLNECHHEHFFDPLILVTMYPRMICQRPIRKGF